MAKAASKRRQARSAFLKAALSLAIALTPTHAYALEEAAAETDPGPVFAYETRDEYMTQHLDDQIAKTEDANPVLDALAGLVGLDLHALPDSGHTLYLKNTLFDASAAGADQTLDGIYARDDWMNIIAGQYGTSADLLDPGADSDYYVAMAAASVQNSLAAPTDHIFAALNNEGEVIEGGIYDYETGLAYLPKTLYQRDGEDVPFACQLQLLMPTDLSGPQTCLTDVSVDCKDFRVRAASGQTIESHAFDVTTTIPVADPETAGHLDLTDIHVRLNGSADELALTEGENAHWDATTGNLEIYASPQTVLRADVSTDAPTLLDLFTEPAHATPTSSLAYVPEVVFDSLNLDTLTVGRKLSFETNINYWWPNPDPGDEQWKACIATGSYCYSWINDPTSLYEYIAWANHADWDGISQHDVSNFFVTPDSSQAMRNYFNYVFRFGDWTLEDQCFHSERWPQNNPDDYLYGTVHFGLQCSHARNPVGNGVTNDDCLGTMTLRVLDVNTEAARPYVVLGFVGPVVAHQPGVGIYKFEILPSGDIEVRKSSSIPEMSANNPNYVFQGITYDVFSDAECTTRVDSIVLDANGVGKSKRLKDGTYYLRENAASTIGRGFAYEATSQGVAVAQGKTSTIDVSDVPQSYAADVILRKQDSVTANATPQGDGTLEGAVFEVRHYRELFADADTARTHAPARTWRFATDSGGTIKLDEAHQTGGGALYHSSNGAPALPLGTLTIQEIAAPEGYRTDDAVRVIPLPSSGTSESITFTNVSTVSEQIKRGGVLIEKRDAESSLTDPLGAASLDGATFEIRNVSAQAVCVDGVMHAPGKVVRRIVSEGGSASTSADALPFGTYEIQEVAAGTGYLASDTEARTFKIEQDAKIVRLEKGQACHNQVKRGDLDLCKIFEGDQSRLARIPFILESKTTGERHVLVTDDNGIVNTSSAWHPHTSLTNANDWVMDEANADSSEIDASKLNPDAGIWFGLAPDGAMTAANDELGALPYDTYELTELRASSNRGLELVSLESIHVTTHGITVPLGNIEDRLIPPPAITTHAKNAEDSSKHLFPKKDARVTDRIDYCNLTPGVEYLFTGRLMDAATGEAITNAAGEEVTCSLSLTPVSPSGSCEVAFEFDAFDHVGKRLVCFEVVTLASTGEVVASHEELTDQGQSVQVVEPLINTYATDEATDTKQIASSGTVTVRDEVSYTGLEEGAEYTLRGQLMRKMGDADALRAEPVLDETGTEVTCAIAFTPTSQTGHISASFTFNPEGTPDGSELVVYETLSRDGRDLVVHESPDNDAQTVLLAAPHIETHAFEKESGLSTTRPSANLVITDEVTYENVTPHATYTLFGTVMVATEDSSGHLSAEPLLDAAGNKVSASVPFSPESSSGSTFLDFTIDATSLDGARLVVYERLVAEGRVVAAHEEPDAESQTIWVESTPTRQPRGLTALPQTGDDTTLGPLVGLSMGALAIGCAAYLITRKRRAREQCQPMMDHQVMR